MVYDISAFMSETMSAYMFDKFQHNQGCIILSDRREVKLWQNPRLVNHSAGGDPGQPGWLSGGVRGLCWRSLRTGVSLRPNSVSWRSRLPLDFAEVRPGKGGATSFPPSPLLPLTHGQQQRTPPTFLFVFQKKKIFFNTNWLTGTTAEGKLR